MKKGIPLLASIADAQAGLHEEPRGSNRGAQLQKFFDADNYDPVPGPGDHGYPWCAAFVCWCVQELMRQSPAGTFGGMKAPRTAAAFGFIDWGRAQNSACLVISPERMQPGGLWPEPGDIVVFEFSHIGIVLSVNEKARNFTSVEGNTDSKGSREGWEVARKPRVFGDVRRFIRLIPTGGREL